ncbi:HlyD family type I secretion periplasmic adaptor subunit [Oryzibacter oryziterrae]|uniref:HlyD family type I secretion periplasmic adaptor subunit n=1 Tax=Oryzibacter oryziterrae TaxID=2766474 RepID=UPI001F02CA57|nr:HlyD family type I secretion periplasmic adaptor subunit [Oryzibacter oryziterrae]
MTAQASMLSPTAELAALRATVDFGSDTAEILNARVPIVARLTLVTLAAMVAAAIALATLLPVERVVSARGRVSAEAPRIMVQPLETSIVRAINVRAGQTVKAGDVLATLDPTFSTADVSALKREVASLQAEIARLTAEVAGKPYAPTSNDLFSTLQQKIYNSRVSQFQSAIATYNGKIASQQSTIDKTEQELALYRQRLGIVSEVEGMKSELAGRKIVARTDLLSVTDTRVEVQRGIASAEGVLDSARHELEALNAQLDNFKQKWQSDSISLLVDRQGALDSAREQLTKADKRADLISMRAPQDAVVLQVADISIGSVVESAQKMFVLVPSDSPLEVDAEISTLDQGFVKVGQQVELKLDAWPYSQHGSAYGTVRGISPDSFAVDQSGSAGARSVYMAKIDITSSDLKKVPHDFHLVPGMTLTADIVIGDHTLSEYLLDRALPTMTEGFREP